MDNIHYEAGLICPSDGGAVVTDPPTEPPTDPTIKPTEPPIGRPDFAAVCSALECDWKGGKKERRKKEGVRKMAKSFRDFEKRLSTN